MNKKLVVIAGPTACGKTKFSIDLAKKINGEIISADSMQVYKYMDIGTAKIKHSDMHGVKHYLIDEFLPSDEFNIMIFKKRAKLYIDEILSKNKVPILVGGTGFYINAVVNDNEFQEEKNDYVLRDELIAFCDKHGVDELFLKLKEVDPESALKIHPNNVKRVIRAIEFFHITGQKFSVHNELEKSKISPYDTKFFILNRDRNHLYDLINLRVDVMIKEGLLSEVDGLLKKGYNKDLVAMQGLGYKEIIPYLENECSLEFAVELLKRKTRNFAKRQLTWFKNQSSGIWLDMDNLDYDKMLEDAFLYVNE